MVDHLLGMRKSIEDQLCLVGRSGGDVLDPSFNGFLLAFRWSLSHQEFQETTLGFFLTGVLVNRWGLFLVSLGNSS